MQFTVLYIFFTAISNIFLHVSGQSIPNMLIVFLSTSYAIFFFSIVNSQNIISVYKKIYRVKKLYILLSIYMFGMWLGAFLIPIYFLPSIYLLSYMTTIAMLGSLSLYLKNKDKAYLIKFVFLFLNLFIFYCVSSLYFHGEKYLILISSTLLTAISGFCYIKLSAKFNQLNYSSSQILAVRFWILWVVALGYVVIKHQFVYINTSVLFSTFIISLFSLIIPVYCSQKSIDKIGPERTSIWIGFTPFVTFLCEYIYLKTNLDYTAYFSISLGIILLASYVYTKFQR